MLGAGDGDWAKESNDPKTTTAPLLCACARVRSQSDETTWIHNSAWWPFAGAAVHLCLTWHVAWVALRNGAQQWASWAFAGCIFSCCCCPRVRACVCVCLCACACAEAAEAAVAAADLTESYSWHAGTQQDAPQEARGQFQLLLRVMRSRVKKWPPRRPEREAHYSSWAVACMLELWVQCSCKDSV